MYNESQKKATMKYLKTQKQIRFWVKPAEYSQIEKAAAAGGFRSLRQFYLYAIMMLIEKINTGFSVAQDDNIE